MSGSSGWVKVTRVRVFGVRAGAVWFHKTNAVRRCYVPPVTAPRVAHDVGGR